MQQMQLSKRALEQTEATRSVYEFKAGGENPQRFVFVDESALNLRTTYRLNGWALRGHRARILAHFQRGKRCAQICTIVALTPASDTLYFLLSPWMASSTVMSASVPSMAMLSCVTGISVFE